MLSLGQSGVRLQHLAVLDEGERTIVSVVRSRLRNAQSGEVREVLGQWTRLAAEQRRRLAAAGSFLRSGRLVWTAGPASESWGQAGGRAPLRMDDRSLLALARDLAGRQTEGYAGAKQIAVAGAWSEVAELLGVCEDRARMIEALLALVADDLGPTSTDLAA
jgi:hypothetical protein